MMIPKDRMECPIRGANQIRLQELEAARRTVRLCWGLGRQELARTLCEHWGWMTAWGAYKVTACLNVLEEWEAKGLLQLPDKRMSMGWRTDRASGAEATDRTNPKAPLVGEFSAMGAVGLEVVQGKDQTRLWNEYVDRYHSLGYRQPMGCSVRYFIHSPAGLLGCVWMAGAAKAIQARDQWIGWNKQRRQENLPWVINNTRLLIFPWVQIGQLGSHVLGQLARGVREDWQERWGYGPLLMETFVDPGKFLGTCYRCAGWIELGMTTGRGLQRAGCVYQSTPKRIYVKALTEDFGERLCGGPLQGRVEV